MEKQFSFHKRLLHEGPTSYYLAQMANFDDQAVFAAVHRFKMDEPFIALEMNLHNASRGLTAPALIKDVDSGLFTYVRHLYQETNTLFTLLNSTDVNSLFLKPGTYEFAFGVQTGGLDNGILTVGAASGSFPADPLLQFWLTYIEKKKCYVKSK